ncbi:hypothetical protein ACRRTK_018276 [Alexandromys fortis]
MQVVAFFFFYSPVVKSHPKCAVALAISDSDHPFLVWKNIQPLINTLQAVFGVPVLQTSFSQHMCS